MAVKTYKTRSIQVAINRIKKDMGSDAMIVSTRRIPKDCRNSSGHSFFEVSAVPQGSLSDAGTEDYFRKDEVSDFFSDSSDHYVKTDDKNSPSGQKTIREELVSIKEMLFLLSNTQQGMPNFFSIYPECLNIYIRLVRTGISEFRAQNFIKKSCIKKGGSKPTKREIAGRVFQEIVKSISVHDPFASEALQSKQKKLRFVGFIGPTGVGKTTTIAKLAADLSLKKKKKVGLISIDNFRIGAVEQLKTYAAIIGIPCVTAFTKEDIQKAIRKLHTRDIVLVDTAGQNHLDKKRMEVLKYFLQGNPPISCHLVLSTTTKRQDMKEAAKHFAHLNPETYIFTKIDETKQRGGIIDQVFDMKMPVSFVTNGQKVPEDIITATTKNLPKLIFDGCT